jgi:GTP-binding protein
VSNRSGADADDLILKVPIGTVVHVKKDLTDRGEDADVTLKQPTLTTDVEVTEVGQRILIAKGGKGGKGNFEFRSSKKTSPTYAQPGLPGEEYEIFLELQLIADVGLIGLPNAGKSSLLNELTKAAVKVANYPFTTLEPNLGVYNRYDKKPVILADIPGLIEGASGGKGLGTKFLRHIARTKVLFHCIASDSKDVVGDYKTIRAELEKHDPELITKKEYIFLTKSDVATAQEIQANTKALSPYGGSPAGRKKSAILVLSIHNTDQLKELQKLLDNI